LGVKASPGGIPNPPLQVTPGSGEEELSVNASIKANIRGSSAFSISNRLPHEVRTIGAG